ncbi:MAG: NlpC/P60 family protein [Acidimicrobiales bacterium]
MKCRASRRRIARSLAAGAATSLLLAAWPAVAAATPGGAGSAGATPGANAPSQAQIDATQAKVSSIEATISQEQQQSEALSQEYDAAVLRAHTYQVQLAATAASLVTTRAAIHRDRAHLARLALRAYVYGAVGTGAPTLFASSANAAGDRSQYERMAIGDLAGARASLDGAESKLAVTEAAQRTEEQDAQTSASQAQALQQDNATATAAAQETLQQVKGTLASEVAAAAQAEAEREAAAAAAARRSQEAAAAAAAAQRAAAIVSVVGGTSQAATAAANRATASAGGTTLTTAGAPTSATGVAAAALGAAESQLGIPYVWGGETPGRGFDCSGLTQWAWAQAGVSIPRTSQAQYAGLSKVWTSATTLTLSSLQPGDLFLYDNLDGTGTVDHVAMYAGGDTLIQAPFTGTVVSYHPIYTDGLVAVARP